MSVYRREDTTTDIIKKVMAATGVPASFFFESGGYLHISQNGKINALGENKVEYQNVGGEKLGVENQLLKVQLDSAHKEIEYLKQIIEMLKSGK